MNGSPRNHHVLLACSNGSPAVSRTLTEAGHTVVSAVSAQEAAAALRRESFDVALICEDLDDIPGVEFAYVLLQQPARPEVIVMATRPDVAQAVSIAKAGAFDYVSDPSSADQVLALVTEAGILAKSKNPTPRVPEHFDQFMQAFLVSSTPAVQEMAALSRMVAQHPDAFAMVVGENGAGKRMLAQIIHCLSPQERAPLVTVNLLDIDPAQLEARIFGSASGEPGALEAARGGTIVLQEISEISLELQAKLLTLLETRRYRPVGGAPGTERDLRARVVATTANDVAALVNSRSFHPSLFYRLAAVLIRVPPLREREGDIPRITEALLAQARLDAGRSDLRLSDDALELLVDHPWPGNLRELRNVITRLSLLGQQDVIQSEELALMLGHPMSLRTSRISGLQARAAGGRRPRTSSMPVPKISGIIAAALDDSARAERDRIEGALEAADGHRERAAATLGMSRTTLWTRMRMLGIDYERFRRSSAV